MKIVFYENWDEKCNVISLNLLFVIIYGSIIKFYGVK